MEDPTGVPTGGPTGGTVTGGLAELLAWWFGRVNYEVRAAQPADLKLERMRALMRLLGDPQDRLRVVHVAGTKGKGSTCAMLAAVLQQAGYRVGLFTSPHLERVEERIQVDRVPIGTAELAARLAEVRQAVERLERGLGPVATFFEIATAVGFLHFLYRRCDIAVIEVGLGGRFDSTNVCRPLVSVITTIGFDHMAQLGPTLEAIAYQKGGIIKRGVPVVCGVEQEGPRRVLRELAAELHAPWVAVRPEDRQRADRYDLPLLGEHQRANCAIALRVVEVLRQQGWSIPEAAVGEGLARLQWPGRIELLGQQPLVVLDTAHNVPSVAALVRTLAGLPVRGMRRVIFAVSSDKQYVEMLQLLAEYFDVFYLTQYGRNPRCVPVERLAAVLGAADPSRRQELYPTSAAAWAAAWQQAAPDDLICVTGSMFLAGELRPLVRQTICSASIVVPNVVEGN